MEWRSNALGERKNSILIVDDEKSNVITLTNILSEEYMIYAAKDGWDAIEAANEFEPDLILLDILMPGMDGYEVITALKKSERTMNTPVIFTTGLDSTDDEELGLTFGAADYICKPFNATIVSLRVRNQMKIVNQLRLIETLKEKDKPAPTKSFGFRKQPQRTAIFVN
jgi:PleD family two-component response regulator